MSTNAITRPECPGCKFCDQKSYSHNRPYCTYPGSIVIEKGKCIRRRTK